MSAENGLGYITELNPTDVLFGRGSGPNDHEGNIRFRQLVAERKDEYLATNHRQTKAKIAREIVNAILIDGGRFLKKVEHVDARQLGIPKGVDAWVAVDDDTVMEKAKQALRQNTNKGANSPLRGNSPARRSVSPVRNRNSPVPSSSPHHRNTSPVPQRQHPMPSFDDLEPLPLTQSNSAARSHSQQQQQQHYSGMTLQRQQQQLQQQVAQQHALQRQQHQLQQHGLGIVETAPLGWGGAPDHNQYAAQTHTAPDHNQYAAQTHTAPDHNHYAAQTHTSNLGVGNWGESTGIVVPSQPVSSLEPTPLWGGSAHGRLQQSDNTMAPPQPRVRNDKNDQLDVNNWGTNSDHTVLTRHVERKGDEEEHLTLEEMRKRRQSLHVEDLMDSFSQMRATGDFSVDAKNQESTDTMGTIEPIGGAYDSTNMSVTSFSSSTFSMFKDPLSQSTDSMPSGRGVSRNSSSNEPRPEARGGTGASTDMMSMQSLNSLNSFGNLSDVWGPRRASLLDKLVQEERERAALQGSATAGDNLAEAPRPVGLMEEEPGSLPTLGTSSLSVMKSAYDSNRARAGNNVGADRSDDNSRGND